MKTYTFPIDGEIGKWETWDGSVDITLTDEEANRLEVSAHAAPRGRLDEDPAISDIYEKVRSLAFEENKRAMQKNGTITMLRKDNEEYDNYTDDQIVDEEMGCWNVSFPKELQYL